jgi:hypothetical protein
VRLLLPGSVSFAGTISTTTTLQSNEVVVTVGRLAAGAEQTISIPAVVASECRGKIEAFGSVTSSTAQPIFTNTAATTVLR